MYDRVRECISHSLQTDNYNLSQSPTQNVNPKTNPSQNVSKPQNQVSNHTKDSTNTDNNRFPNTEPKVQQVANHLTTRTTVCKHDPGHVSIFWLLNVFNKESDIYLSSPGKSDMLARVCALNNEFTLSFDDTANIFWT